MTDRICVADSSCTRPIFSNGLCATHYHRQRRLQVDGGKLPTCLRCGAEFARTRQFRLYCSAACLPRCAVDDCEERTQAKGLCGRHYTEAKRGPRKRPTATPCPSVNAYRRGCRCEGCTEANRLYARGRTDGKPLPPLEARPHGANRYTRQSCRCDVCRAGNAERRRVYAAKKPAVVKRINQASNFKRKSAPFTQEALEYLKVIRDDPCSYCLGPGGTIDHIDPICGGGTSDWWNLAAACKHCNSVKKEKPLLAFLLYACRIEDEMKMTHPDASHSEDVRPDAVEMYESQGWAKAKPMPKSDPKPDPK